METGELITLKKPSLFSRLWVFSNAYGGQVGIFRTKRRLGYFRAEGEVGGATLSFLYPGWGTRNTEVRDEWGRVCGTMRRSWCSPSAHLLLYEKEYVWDTKKFGSVFSIAAGETTLLQISGSGGFGMEAHMKGFVSLEKTEALILAYMGMFQQKAFENEVALSTAFVSLLVLFSGSFLL